MIQEDYCSFEIGELLLKKGYNGPVEQVYTEDGTGSTPIHIGNWRTKSKIPKITHQMACAWLREEHNLFIFPFPQMNTNKFWTEIFQLSNNQEWENLYCESIDLQDYSTYEEAVEAALKYTLKNLI